MVRLPLILFVCFSKQGPVALNLPVQKVVALVLEAKKMSIVKDHGIVSLACQSCATLVGFVHPQECFADGSSELLVRCPLCKLMNTYKCPKECFACYIYSLSPAERRLATIPPVRANPVRLLLSDGVPSIVRH